MDRFKNNLRIKNNTKYLAHVRDMLASSVRGTGLSKKEGKKVAVAVDEAITNIIEHAYENRKEGWIAVEVTATPDKLRITIEDSGKRFNPNLMEDPDVREHVDEGKKKGLGIFLMRQIMDEVQYRFTEENKNEICLVKYIGEE